MGVAFTSTDESPGSTLSGNTGQDIGFTITQVCRRTTDQGMIPAVANYLGALSSQDKGGMRCNATPRGHTRGSRVGQEAEGHGNTDKSLYCGKKRVTEAGSAGLGWAGVSHFSKFWVTRAVLMCVSLALR